jgi:hypothetical protein
MKILSMKRLTAMLVISITVSFFVIACNPSTEKDTDATWIYYTSDPDGCSYYYDSNSIEYHRNNTFVIVRKKIDCHGNKKIRQAKVEIDCQSGKYREKYEPYGWLEVESRDPHDPLHVFLCNK